eukprot:TRINITY_DN2334_c0_g1_i2.p1 TRINITY_DN2334_c0_g1~~TRINITY_DN2334_c0_g1_i2.p1  ORF type:complete len:599 (-),score=124.46 TRINITY_DN2334_c0_g1_i2:307-2103(-)
MAAEAEAAGSGGGAGSVDSYIGSLISLTSKAEIRYEGILFNINTKESSIGLKNVRSFGTEGRKKDGPQISPSDKVYEYILFRGSDIKDLQVKSAPPVQPTPPPIYSDPAIIQSHYSQPASSSTSMPSVGSVTMEAHSSHTVQPGLPRSTLQGGLPLHQTGGSVGAWGSSPAHPSANGSGLALPMYWQGFYGPSGGLPHVQQQHLFQPPPGLPIPHSMQQQMQYPVMSSSPPTGSPYLPEVSFPLLPPVGTSSSQVLTLATLPPTLASIQAAPLPPDMSSSLMPNKAPTSSFPVTTPSWNLPLASLPSTLNTSADQPRGSSKQLTVPGLTLPYQPASQSVSVLGGPSTSSQAETSVPSLVTPHQLIQPAPTTVSSVQPLQTGKDIEAVQPPLTVPSASAPAAPETKAPLLPLPTLSDQKLNGTGLLTHHSNGVHERRRGNEISHSTTNFTEEFDFIAMNEKFKKDEVWGHLGRSKIQSRAKEGIANDEDADVTLEEGDAGPSESEVKPVYIKDDFFDTLSCNALDRGYRNERPRFSEQMKIDTETFGDFPRHRGWGGRGPGRGGRSRGAYHGRGYGYGGRGYGYGGRGRGPTMSNHTHY